MDLSWQEVHQAYDRAFGKPLSQIVIFRLAFSQAEPPAVIMDYHADMIRVVDSNGLGRSTANGPTGAYIHVDQKLPW